jgi:hypothetical protein
MSDQGSNARGSHSPKSAASGAAFFALVLGDVAYGCGNPNINRTFIYLAFAAACSINSATSLG